ncbi:uncharacterized protein [Primulina eburnea]|uniref:uncharacterized protein n=1 Tax=Primulina eburnea TaxID=1245227 RepID=UPI003C6BE044
MAKWGFMLLLFLLVSHRIAARFLPSDAGFTDQKNFVAFNDVGSYAGLGDNGIPFVGVGGGVGAGGDIGGVNGFSGIGGVIGTGPAGGGFGSGAGGIGGAAGGFGRGASGGSGGGAVLPQP